MSIFTNPGAGINVPEFDMRALVASERMLPDGNLAALHYSGMIYALPPHQAEIRDTAEPAVVSWVTGRRLWAAGVRSLHAGPATYDGPPYVHLKGVIPARLLAAVDRYQWGPDDAHHPGDHSAHTADWDRLPGEEMLDFARSVTDGHPWGFATTEPFMEFYLMARTPPSSLHVHADGNLDPTRRWLGLVGYFTSPRNYQGADLVFKATGEHLRPARGDVIIVRGDVEHSVTPLTAGRRVVLTAFKGEPPP